MVGSSNMLYVMLIAVVSAFFEVLPLAVDEDLDFFRFLMGEEAKVIESRCLIGSRTATFHQRRLLLLL